MLVFAIFVSFIIGLIAGVNIESHIQDVDCLRAEAIYSQVVKNFKKDLHTGAGDELLMADEYRRFEHYMDMESTCQ